MTNKRLQKFIVDQAFVNILERAERSLSILLACGMQFFLSGPSARPMHSYIKAHTNRPTLCRACMQSVLHLLSATRPLMQRTLLQRTEEGMCLLCQAP